MLNYNSVSIGCFSCKKQMKDYGYLEFKSRGMFEVWYEKVPNDVTSMETLVTFWKKLHQSPFNFPERKEEQKCQSISSYKWESQFSIESCKVFEAFFQHINCSNFQNCSFFYAYKAGLRIEPPGQFLNHQKIYPIIHHEKDYLFQLIVPKVYPFDTNLSAYLTPFPGNVWGLILLAIAAVSGWMIWLEEIEARRVIQWNIEVILEQDCSQFKGCGFPGKTIAMMWIFVAIFLRNFYNSSLYSYMTAEKGPTDFPNNLEQLIGRKDFDILLPIEFWNVYFLLSTAHGPNKAYPEFKQITRFVYNALYMSEHLSKEAIQNASLGNYAKVWHFPPNHSKHNSSELLNPIIPVKSYKRLTKYAILCENDCEDHWNVPFFGIKGISRIVPKQKPFLRTKQFWMLEFPTFATARFQTFFGFFVQSGLYELSINRFRQIQLLKRLQELSTEERLGLSDGRLFSYVFLADRLQSKQRERATKISALTGTFIIVSCMASAAFVVLLLELHKRI
ncbi:unnamed protein product [Orchesella dallaii]|uniref:Uncharacterized protein n=1 Tax=Orchesella dallaii TaxID=48710 RepID=A0ABP1QUM5_9HEXA